MTSNVAQLIADKISKRTLRVAVLGTGYVGLPTAALFANAGFSVTAVDVNVAIVEKVNNGHSPIDEPGLQQLVSGCVKNGKLSAVLFSQSELSQHDCVLISVQTPINEEKKPDLSYLMNAVEVIGRNLRRGMLVILCSTVPPHTLTGKIKPSLETLSGLDAETDFFLAYVPERIAPGKALKELVENTRLAGGLGAKSAKLAADLFGTICKDIVVTDAVTAEISKLAENTFRTVNIAYANQLALLCEAYCADVTMVVKLANTHPRVNIHFSGPGVGGPCLTKDPYLLVDRVQTQGGNLIDLAGAINDIMPHHVVELVLRGLKSSEKNTAVSSVAVLGTAYKGDVGDSRFSPSEQIIKELLGLGLKVTVFDPFCKETFGAVYAQSAKAAVEGADCLVVVTDHSEFKFLDLGELKKFMGSRPVLVDCRRLFDVAKVEGLGFSYYGVGYGKSPITSSSPH
jgi:UDP-N-acetyl-D-mannosaminuronic acid dehydrogenase